MKNKSLISCLIGATVASGAYAQVGLSDQDFGSVNVTADYVLSQDQNYVPYTLPSGPNPTLTHSWNSGIQVFNTATISATYTDMASFGALAATASMEAHSGTNRDVNYSNAYQNLYGLTDNDFQGTQANASFEDTFTANQATTFSFDLQSVYSFINSASTQGGTNSFSRIYLDVNVNGGYYSSYGGDLLYITGSNDALASISVSAGDVVGVRVRMNVHNSADTYYAQTPNEFGSSQMSVNSILYVSPTPGTTYRTGSGVAYRVAPAPEPMTLLPLALGVLVLVKVRK